MSLANIKLNSAQRGFTIVELLIVVVVIAVLAAITIVSYNGITTRANASAAKSLVATWQKKIELYQAEEGVYPYQRSNLSSNTSKSYYIDASSLNGATALTSSTGTSKVQVRACGAATPTSDAAVTRIEIRYWDFEATTPAAVTTAIGGAGAACTAYWS